MARRKGRTLPKDCPQCGADLEDPWGAGVRREQKTAMGVVGPRGGFRRIVGKNTTSMSHPAYVVYYCGDCGERIGAL